MPAPSWLDRNWERRLYSLRRSLRFQPYFGPSVRPTESIDDLSLPLCGYTRAWIASRVIRQYSSKDGECYDEASCPKHEGLLAADAVKYKGDESDFGVHRLLWRLSEEWRTKDWRLVQRHHISLRTHLVWDKKLHQSPKFLPLHKKSSTSYNA